MPAGCDFTCTNKECEYVNSGFIISDSWPLGRIELVIENPQVKKMVGFRDKLIERKDNGIKYVCLVYPNSTEIPIEGYRNQYWCSKCKCVWNNDVMLKEDQVFKDIKEELETMEKCPECKCSILGFDDVIEQGINCIHCNKKLQQNRWFSKEEE